MESETKETVLNEKTADAIVLLRRKGPSYPKRISEVTDTTYSHMVRILKKLEKQDLVQSEKRGRKKVYKLTSRGRELGDELVSLYDVMVIKKDYNTPTRDEGRVKPSLSDSLQERYG